MSPLSGLQETRVATREESGVLGFPSRCYASQLVLVVKNPPANAGDVRDMGSIPRLGRSLGGGHGQKSPDTPGSPEGNTEGPGNASSEPLLPS